MWCLLDVPHLARLSRLCRGRPRPYSRRLPARGDMLFFWLNILSVYSYVYININLICVMYENGRLKNSLHSLRVRSQGLDPRSALLF